MGRQVYNLNIADLIALNRQVLGVIEREYRERTNNQFM